MGLMAKASSVVKNSRPCNRLEPAGQAVYQFGAQKFDINEVSRLASTKKEKIVQKDVAYFLIFLKGKDRKVVFSKVDKQKEKPGKLTRESGTILISLATEVCD